MTTQPQTSQREFALMKLRERLRPDHFSEQHFFERDALAEAMIAAYKADPSCVTLGKKSADAPMHNAHNTQRGLMQVAQYVRQEVRFKPAAMKAIRRKIAALKARRVARIKLYRELEDEIMLGDAAQLLDVLRRAERVSR